MIALGIVLAHLTGDYLIQSDWMAIEKTKRWWPAIVHGVTYTAPYALVTQSLPALLVIGLTHIVIDRYRLVRYVIWFSNLLSPKSYRHPWAQCTITGFHTSRPEWLAVTLMFVIDNTIHLLINTGAVLWL